MSLENKGSNPCQPVSPSPGGGTVFSADAIRAALWRRFAGHPKVDIIRSQFASRLKSVAVQYPAITPDAAAWQAAWELIQIYGDRQAPTDLPLPPPGGNVPGSRANVYRYKGRSS